MDMDPLTAAVNATVPLVAMDEGTRHQLSYTAGLPAQTCGDEHLCMRGMVMNTHGRGQGLLPLSLFRHMAAMAMVMARDQTRVLTEDLQS